MRGSCNRFRYRILNFNNEGEVIKTTLCSTMKEITDVTGMIGRSTIKKHILNPNRLTNNRFKQIKIEKLQIQLPKFKKNITYTMNQYENAENYVS